MRRRRFITSVLHYTERSQGKFRDLRQVEVNVLGRFARITLNGQYRDERSRVESNRFANPGWSFGFEHAYFNWTHFRRHCWHACVNVRRRGVTFSYGRNIV